MWVSYDFECRELYDYQGRRHITTNVADMTTNVAAMITHVAATLAKCPQAVKEYQKKKQPVLHVGMSCQTNPEKNTNVENG